MRKGRVTKDREEHQLRSYEERKSDKRAGRKNSESNARNNDE
jgi:hypothetical protein